MLRLPTLLATMGAALLLVSFLPWPGARTLNQPDQAALLARQIDHGRVLFRDKGCAACHVHQQVPPQGGECCRDFGPELSAYGTDPAFLVRWLAAPASVRPQTMMPDLELSDAEIADLIVFLNQSRP
jgi:cytochrome c2